MASDGTLQSNSYNITSTVKNSTGNYTITWNTDFSNTDYTINVTAEGNIRFIRLTTIAVGSVIIDTFADGSTAADSALHISALGDQ